VTQEIAIQRLASGAGLDLPIDEDRLMKEVMFFADKSDVTEELTRVGR
jgi:uncharacterized protein YicC (UPF0701 family)